MTELQLNTTPLRLTDYIVILQGQPLSTYNDQ